MPHWRTSSGASSLMTLKLENCEIRLPVRVSTSEAFV